MTKKASWIGKSTTINADLPFRPIEDPEAQSDDWFGVMNYYPEKCHRRGVPRGFEARKFLVIHNDLPCDHPTRKAIDKVVDDSMSYAVIPLIEITCDEDVVESVKVMKGIKKVIPALEGHQAIQSIAIGIDFLVWHAMRQHTMPPSDELYGGRKEGGPPGYPVVKYGPEGWYFDVDPSIPWSVRPAVMPVINMSLGTWQTDYPFVINDIINVCTAGAIDRDVLVVVSAGNCGLKYKHGNTMSAWAQAPWVLSVGASADKEGRKLEDYSSRGVEDDPDSGPDVVAYGYSRLPPHPKGTSFAAPRVSFFAMLCVGALLQLKHGFEVAAGQEIEGIPLVGMGMVDSFIDGIFSGERINAPALPVVGIDSDGVNHIASLAKRNGVKIHITYNPQLIRKLLLRAANSMVGYKQHEVGAGFLDLEIVVDNLASLNGADILNEFADGSVPEPLANKASNWRVFNREELYVLAEVITATSPHLRYDWRRARFGMCPNVGENHNELDPDDRKYGIKLDWPPGPSGGEKGRRD